MTWEEFTDLVAAGERPGVEFKNARARTDNNLPEVVKTVIGMANRRDGGLILIGLEDNGNVTGLTDAQVTSWATADPVRQSLAQYVDPHAYVDVEVVSAGHLRCVVLKVQEFDQVPVLCARAANDSHGHAVLRLGACYVRSRQLPSTTEIADHAEFRELLDLAIDKGVREFLRRAGAAGLQIDAVSDRARFRAELENPFDE